MLLKHVKMRVSHQYIIYTSSYGYILYKTTHFEGNSRSVSVLRKQLEKQYLTFINLPDSNVDPYSENPKCQNIFFVMQGSCEYLSFRNLEKKIYVHPKPEHVIWPCAPYLCCLCRLL